MCVFAMLAALMFASKKLMELLPNIHLLGALTVAYTAAFRKKAFIPLYLYIIIEGLFSGFATWWIAYLYIWAPLALAILALPKNIPDRVAAVLYPTFSGLHGLAFGILYAPAQAIIFGLDFEGTLAWIAAGLPMDVIHGISNFAFGFLALPLSRLLLKLSQGKYTG